MPVTVTVYFAAMAALCFAAGPVWRICLGLGFALLHELGHLAALALCGGRPSRICLTAAGMRMERPPGLALGFRQEIAIALAGPGVNVFLAGMFAVWAFPRLLPVDSLLMDCFWLNLGFGIFNLLPVRQLDGGRVLYYALCQSMGEPAARRVQRAASLVCLFFAAFLAALLCLQRGGSVTLVLVVFYLAVCV